MSSPYSFAFRFDVLPALPPHQIIENTLDLAEFAEQMEQVLCQTFTGENYTILASGYSAAFSVEGQQEARVFIDVEHDAVQTLDDYRQVSAWIRRLIENVIANYGRVED